MFHYKYFVLPNVTNIDFSHLEKNMELFKHQNKSELQRFISAEFKINILAFALILRFYILCIFLPSSFKYE